MKNDQPDLTKPVAYDVEGRPLYHRPATDALRGQSQSLVSSKPESYEGHNFDPKLRAQYANEPDFVHAERAIEPKVLEISQELQQKHQESLKRYPFLNLSEGEYVILQIKRHPIGMLIPILSTVFSIIILVSLAFLVPDFFNRLDPMAGSGSGSLLSEGIVIGVLMLLAFLAVVVGGTAVWVYQKNQFFMTNESVIQEIQHGIFSHREQTVSLGSIEDASFRRQGIMQHLFNYGTMRLSTEGEETTYRFAFVEDPKNQIAIVSNAVEAFKNGRPVRDD